MSTEEFEVVATRLLEREEWWPTISDFVDEARKIRRTIRLRREHEELRRRAERRKREIGRKGREMFDDAIEAGKSIAEALREGELDFDEMRRIIERHDRQLPPATEERYESAGKLEKRDHWEDFR